MLILLNDALVNKSKAEEIIKFLEKLSTFEESLNLINEDYLEKNFEDIIETTDQFINYDDLSSL